MDGEIVPKSPSCPKVAHKAPSVATALPEPWDADGTASLPAHCSALKGPCATWHCSPGHSTGGAWGRNVAVTPDSCPLPPGFLMVGRSVLDEGDLLSQAELCGATKQFLHFQN